MGIGGDLKAQAEDIINGEELIQAVMNLMEWTRPNCEGYDEGFDEDWNNLKDLVKNV